MLFDPRTPDNYAELDHQVGSMVQRRTGCCDIHWCFDNSDLRRSDKYSQEFRFWNIPSISLLQSPGRSCFIKCASTVFTATVHYATASFTLNSIVLFSFILDRLLLFPVNLVIVSIAVSDWVIGVVHGMIAGVANVSQQRSFNANACNFYTLGTCLLGFSNNCSNCAGQVPGNLSANESQSFNGRSWWSLLACEHLPPSRSCSLY